MEDSGAGNKRKPLSVIDGNARQTRSRTVKLLAVPFRLVGLALLFDADAFCFPLVFVLTGIMVTGARRYQGHTA
eukprot:977912-Rhodomonas_salina.1